MWCLGRQWTRLKTPKWTLERIPAILTRLLKALKKGSLMEDTERGQNTSIELYFLYWHLINVFVSHINVVYKRTIGIQEHDEVIMYFQIIEWVVIVVVGLICLNFLHFLCMMKIGAQLWLSMETWVM